MTKHISAFSLATLAAFFWTSTAVHAQMTGPQPGSAAPQLLNVPTSGAPANGQKNKQDAVGIPAQLEDTLRDPFWPIGYSPPKAQTDVGPAVPDAPVEPELPNRKWEQAQKALSIKGIIKSGATYLANINNQILGANDKVSIYFDSQKYVWKITSITAKSVQFQPDPVESDAPASEEENDK